MGILYIIEVNIMNKHEKYSIKNYNKIAGSYDSSYEGRFTAGFKAKMLDMCTVTDGDMVLDVGCGNGDFIYNISKTGNIKAYGVDLSPNMIEECRSRYSAIEFSVSSGEKLPFNDGIFDMLTICCVLHHLNDPVNFFREAKRVLKQSSILLVGEPWFPFGVRHFFDWIISPILKAGDNKIFSHKRLQKLFINSGFSIVEIYKKGKIQIIKGRKL